MASGSSRRSRRIPVIALAVASGVVAAFAGASPTGVDGFDFAATALVVGVITWVGVAAPWWALTLSAGIALATVGDIVLMVIACVALVASAWVGTRRRTLHVVRAVIAGTVLNVLVRSELGGFLGASAIVGCGVAILMLVTATRRRTRTQRRWIVATSITLSAAVFLAITAQAASTLAARSTLTSAVEDVRDGLDLLADGNTEAAVERLNLAVRDMDWALSTIDSGWTQPARLVPVVAQNRRTLVSLADDARSLTEILATQLDRIDLDALKPNDGHVDLDQVATVTSAAEEILQSIENLRANLGEDDSVWLAGPVSREVGELRSEIDLRLDDARDARDTIYIVPSLLGQDGPRRYFLAFTTPAEARGGGGFMGSWAEVVADRGRITLERTGRTSDLNSVGWPERQITGPADLLARYGSMGLSYPGSGLTAPDVWSLINLSPHFPSTAQAITELYPQSGGANLDGVISLDAYALATLVDFSGPISLTTVDETLDGNNAAEFLLYDQYRLEDTSINRVDVLEEVTRKVVERILEGMVPAPTEVVDNMLPLTREGRIVAYSVHQNEQDVFERLHIDGSLSASEFGDVLSVSFNNANANKIDVFLDADLAYDVTVDADGRTRSTATITLTNSAPTSGWPGYTIGNVLGLPVGTNRLWVTVHSRLRAQSASVDGVPEPLAVSGEEGLYANDVVVDIAPGAQVTITLDFEGVIVVDPMAETIPLTLRLPAAVRPVPATVTYTGPTGVTLTSVVDRPGTHRGLDPTA